MTSYIALDHSSSMTLGIMLCITSNLVNPGIKQFSSPTGLVHLPRLQFDVIPRNIFPTRMMVSHKWDKKRMIVPIGFLLVYAFLWRR